MAGLRAERRLRWNPLEKLAGAMGASLILIYLLEWTLFVLHVDASGQRAAGASVAAVGAGLTIWRRRQLAALFRVARVRQVCLGYLFLAVWTLVVLTMIRHYSGGQWFGDWLEHFQRTLFILHRFPPETPIFGGYVLPARPPMMNAIAAFFLAGTADRFEVFQVVFAMLNLLVLFPAALLLPALAGGRRSRIVPLTALLALSPVVLHNATYTWTKEFAAFYVLLGLWFYLKGWRKRDGIGIAAGFMALAAGVLVHYSAAPYLLFVAVHYLLAVWRGRPRKARELAVIATGGALLLATWFGWSLATYGARGTFATNTSVTSAKEYEGSNLLKIAGNFVDTIVPAALRDPASVQLFEQPSAAGMVRDIAFVLYQNNVVFAMGIVGGPVVLWLLWLELRKQRTPERRFWLLLIPFCLLAGIAVVGERGPLGVGHLTLLPLELLGLTLLAGVIPLRRTLAIAILCGCALDFSLGVLLQARVENLDAFPAPAVVNGRVEGRSGQLSEIAQRNWFRKHQLALSEDVLRQAPAAEFQEFLKEDATLWHGWYARHGGSVEFLGDRLGGDDVQTVLLVLMFLGLEWRLWKSVG